MKSQQRRDSRLSRSSTGGPPASIDEAWKEFKAFLRQRAERITEPRRIVLRQAMVRRDHFRADDLAGDLAEGQDRVSRGTVYRTLALLVQAGLIREIRDRDAHVHYESVFGREHHEHMVCDRCGRFVEFTDTDIAAYIHRACRLHRFRQRNHRVIVFGLCEHCRE